MVYSPISMARRHVLGDLYHRCDPSVNEIPVYLAGAEPQLLGHADQALGHYADAFTFHLADDICKKLSAGQYTYSFEYEHSDAANTTSRSRVILTSITLNERKNYERPRSKSSVAAEAAESK